MLVYFAVLLIPLLGFCGLAIDAGRVELRSLQLQAAADSAAVSAATEYQRTGSLQTATNAATSEIASNASLNNIPAATPTVTYGATSGAYANDHSTIQVTVTQSVPNTLMSLIMGSNSFMNASATSVAMIPPCIFLLGNPSVVGRGGTNLALSSQGFTLTCPVYSTTGYFVDGFSYINLWQAKASGPPSQTYGGGWEWPAVIFNAPVLPDPLAYIVAPAFSSCDHTNMSYTTPAVLAPGTYCGGLKVTNTSVTLLPGLYLITGGVTLSGATVTGTGVTMYLTKGGGSGYGQFCDCVGSSFKVSAPTDASAGGIPGILLFGDRNWVGGNEDFRFDQSSMKGDGIIYTTGTGIYDWQTALSGYRYFGFVTANFSFQNAPLTFSTDYSQLPGGSPFHTVVSLVQ